MQVDHQKKQLKTKEVDMKKTESTFANDKKQLDKFEREIQNFEVYNFFTQGRSYFIN